MNISCVNCNNTYPNDQPGTCETCGEHICNNCQTTCDQCKALTLPWLKPRDSCELGLLVLGR